MVKDTKTIKQNKGKKYYLNYRLLAIRNDIIGRTWESNGRSLVNSMGLSIEDLSKIFKTPQSTIYRIKDKRRKEFIEDLRDTH